MWGNVAISNGDQVGCDVAKAFTRTSATNPDPVRDGGVKGVMQNKGIGCKEPMNDVS